MTTPLKTFYGQAGGPKVYEGRVGTTDDGTAFGVYAKTRPIQPGDTSGETVFSAFFLAITWTMAAVIRVTPIVDGIAYDGTGDTTDERRTITLTAQDTRKSQTFLLPMMRRLLDPVDPDITISKFFFRGTRVQALIETIGELGDGDLIFDEVVVEAKPVLDTKTVVAT